MAKAIVRYRIFCNDSINHFKITTMPLEIIDEGGEGGGGGTPQPPTLEEIMNQSGQLTNRNLPGINHLKRTDINNYVAGIIQAQSLNASKVQILMKDIGSDISVTIYNDGVIHSQINYSQIPQLL
ncbi:MAG: hypothetical protein IT234_00930 [Bacteroidia bacterium]|nr:hypothetical protein [Bacteroidia bacterium]